jgi:hypothetical protein
LTAKKQEKRGKGLVFLAFPKVEGDEEEKAR